MTEVDGQSGKGAAGARGKKGGEEGWGKGEGAGRKEWSNGRGEGLRVGAPLENEHTTRGRGDFGRFTEAQSLDPDDLAGGAGCDHSTASGRNGDFQVGEEILELGGPGEAQRLKAVPRAPMTEMQPRADGVGVQRLTAAMDARAPSFDRGWRGRRKAPGESHSAESETPGRFRKVNHGFGRLKRCGKARALGIQSPIIGSGDNQPWVDLVGCFRAEPQAFNQVKGHR